MELIISAKTHASVLSAGLHGARHFPTNKIGRQKPAGKTDACGRALSYQQPRVLSVFSY